MSRKSTLWSMDITEYPWIEAWSVDIVKTTIEKHCPFWTSSQVEAELHVWAIAAKPDNSCLFPALELDYFWSRYFPSM